MSKTGKLFGTDGIRARAGDAPLNEAMIDAVGEVLAGRLKGTILVGEDTRTSCPWIEGILSEGIRRGGAAVDRAGVLPTPAVALLVREYGYAGGVMISASHNPFFDNGLKIFGSDGAKLDDVAETEIEQAVFRLVGQGKTVSDAVSECRVTAENGTVWPERYEQLLLSRFPSGAWMKGLRVVVDCANGAMSSVAPRVIERLGAEVASICAAPTGRNINEGCGAVHLEPLRAAMGARQADFGVAFDGDGDRALFISSSGQVVDGDSVLWILARRLKQAGRLIPPVVIGTSMTNFGLEQAFEREGIQLVRVGVGDRFIFEEMRKGPLLGGEPSGHTILPDFGLSGDGLLTALNVAYALIDEGRSLDSLIHGWTPAPHLLKGIQVLRRTPLEAAPVLAKVVEDAKQALEGRGRVVVRYSGTEPLLRLMIESDDAAVNEVWMAAMVEAVQSEFGDRDRD